MKNIFLIFIVLFILWHGWDQAGDQVQAGGFKTTHFHLSGGASKDIFNKMLRDKVHPETIKHFLQLENQLLKVEQASVCSGNPRDYEAFALSSEIKDTFTGYDFSYHTKHLKQIAEPNKIINQNVKC